MWAQVALGEHEAAFALLERRVAEGNAYDLHDLDWMPAFATLRADPRFERALAPARTRLAAQVQAAQAAGLL